MLVVMVVAAVSGGGASTARQQSLQTPKTTSHGDAQGDRRRPPLLPAENDNNGVTSNPKRPKSKVVTSRYMSPSRSTSTSNSSSASSSTSSSRRFPSPLVPRNSTSVSNSPALVPKRSVSVDRRRLGTTPRPLTADLDPKQGNASEASAATKLLVTATRSLSVSFQGEAFSLPIKTKVAPAFPNLSSVRKGTPERRSSTPTKGKVDGRGDQGENSKPVDQQRWPARTRLVSPLSRSLDCSGGERSKIIGSANVIRAMQQSMIDERRASFDGRLSIDLDSAELLKGVHYGADRNSVNNEPSVHSDLTASDTDSVSSGSTSGAQECNGGVSSRLKGGPRGIVDSARFWQETNCRLRRLQVPGSPLASSPGSKSIVTPKLKRYSSDIPMSSPRTMSSPIRGGIRAASPSPSKIISSSPSRGMSSPSRIRNAVSTINTNFVETPSVLSFALDVRRGKVGENRVVDAHLLRLLYNRHLQWRFVNARSEATLLVQKHSAEKSLWNAWITISDLRDTVTKKRHRLQLLRQKLKLASILKGQVMELDEWASLDDSHSISLLGATEALKASTLRLPVGGGAVADIQSLKEAVGSAVDMMQAMSFSICSLLPKVDEVNSLVIELAKLTAKEKAQLGQCKDLLASLAAIQVKDCSLRTHILQQNRVRNSLT